MGHRANYAIREGGRVELFYSHWGGLTVPEDVFWGPEHAESFIRTHERADGWLDTVRAEGGVALDKDERTCVLYGGEELALPPAQQTFIDLMQALWAPRGWRVRWAERELCEVAEQVGADSSILRSPLGMPRPADLSRLGARVDDGDVLTLVSLRAPDGSVSDLAADASHEMLLAAGPELLLHLHQLPLLEQALEAFETRRLRDGQEAVPLGFGTLGALCIQPVGRRLDCASFCDPPRAEHLRMQWPGWELTFHSDGPSGHFRRDGRSAPDCLGLCEGTPVPEPSREGCLHRVADLLLRERPPDPLGRVDSVVESLSDEAAVVYLRPAVSTAPGRPDRDTARRLLEEAVRALADTPATGGADPRS